MDWAYNTAVVVITFGLLVTIHEFGHFWAARRAGVKVLRFSIGFGKVLWRWSDRQGTEYAVGILPLGGYVKMLDEREGAVAVADRGRAFNRQRLGQRVWIVAAGPLANFVLAVGAYWLIFVSGVTGVVPVIGSVEEGSLGAQAGLEAGMEIVSVDGSETPTWRAVNERLVRRIGESGALVFGARYPDSDIVYEFNGTIHRWLADSEQFSLMEALGLEFYFPPTPALIEKVVAGSPADVGGLRSGDQVVSVNGDAIADWRHWERVVRAGHGERLDVGVVRGGATLYLEITPAPATDSDGRTFGRVGVAAVAATYPPELLREFNYNPVSALGAAMTQTWTMTVFTLESIQKLIRGLISPKNLSGPITIAKVATASAHSGLESWLGVLALLSISLGVLNLLPIPVLDGGHLLYFLVEWVKGSPVSERVQNLGMQIGLALVLGIMLLAVYNDLGRL